MQDNLRRPVAERDVDRMRARAERLRRTDDPDPPKPVDLLARVVLLFLVMLVIGFAADAYFGSGAP